MGARLTLLATLTITLSLLGGCESTSSMNFNSDPISMLQLHEGNADLQGPRAVLVNSPQELAALGSEELANKPINFDQRSLIVVALGEKATGGYSLKITGVQRHGDVLYVQGIATEPGADAIVTQALSHPYAAVEIAKVNSNLTVIPEIDTVTAGR